MFWEKEIECLSTDQLKNMQTERLKETLVAASRTPFYSRLFKSIRFDPERFSSLDQLREIPFTTKDDLRSNVPYGFLAVSRDDVVRVHSSSGTTGVATPIFHTSADIDRWANLVARCMFMTGARKNDVFQNTMGYGLFTGGLGFHYGAEKIGMMTIPSGPGNSRRQIYLMQTFGTTIVHILPSYALRLYSVFEEMGLDPKTDTELRIAYIGAEPHSEGMRQKIEQLYGIDAFNSYGLSEMNGPGVAFECPEKNGMHVWEDSYIMEVIDPVTLDPVPDGEEGELVFTTLGRQATPILRYRTRDLASIIPGPCPCGRTHRRISRIKGRTDDMLIVKGVNIFPIQIERVLMGIPEVGTDYQIVLDKKNYLDSMTVRVEINAKLFDGDIRHLEEIQRKIVEELRAEISIEPEVELLEPGNIPKAEGKAVRVIDRRE